MECMGIMATAFAVTFCTLFMFNDQIKAKSVELAGVSKQQVQKVESIVQVAIKIGEPMIVAKTDVKKNNSCNNNCNNQRINYCHCYRCHGRRPLLTAAAFAGRVILAPARFIFCR